MQISSTAIVSLLALATTLLRPFDLTAQTGRRGRYAASPYPLVNKALALVTAGEARGSGFIWSTGDREYLVTAEHILRGGRPLTARLLDGTSLKLTTMEIAEGRDLIRFAIQVPPGATALSCRSERPAPDDTVWVFGDSDATGVVTIEGGKIMGVGSDRIEINAKIVAGNSGSPVIDSSGQVMAVATHAQIRTNPDDWIASGTRYREVRRYGFLLAGARWKPLESDDYFLRVDALADIATFCEDLREVYTSGFFDVFVDSIKYSYVQRADHYRRMKNLCQAIEQSVRSRNLIVERHGRAMQALQESQSGRHRGARSLAAEHEAAWQTQLALQEHEKMSNHFFESLALGERLLDHAHWPTQGLQQEAQRLLAYLRSIKQHYDMEPFRPGPENRPQAPRR